MKCVRYLRPKVLFLLCIMTLSFMNVLPTFADTLFSVRMKQEFFQFIVSIKNTDFMNYNAYAIHDFDGDGIPEVLLGNKNEENENLIAYDVFKYAHGDFKKIGYLSESRYLIKDKYSNALLSVNGYQQFNISAEVQVANYYVHNNTLQKNIVLSSLANGYCIKNDIEIPYQRFEEELHNFVATYDELMIHDSFNFSVIYAAIYSWRPSNFFAPKPDNFNTYGSLTEGWQEKYKKFLFYMCGPMDTYKDNYLMQNKIRKDYKRFSLYDFDGDEIPELLAATSSGTHYSFDVFKYINSDITFLGSFDGYSKYIAKLPQSTVLFSYDPIGNLFNYQSARFVASTSLALDLTEIMAIYPNPYNPKDTIYSLYDSPTTYAQYNNSLLYHYNACTEIQSYDTQMVPYAAILAAWEPLGE